MRAFTALTVSFMALWGCALSGERDEIGLVYQSDPATFPDEPPPAPAADAGMPQEDAAVPEPDASEPDATMPAPDAGPTSDAGPPAEDAGECTAAPTLTVPDLPFIPGPSHPTGTVGQLDVLLGRFVDHLGCEPLEHVQFTILDDVAGADQTLADTYQNLKLWMVNADGSRLQIGYTFGTLTDVDGTTYLFTPSSAIRRESGSQTYEVRADVKYGATLITDDSVVRVERVQSVGVESGEGYDLGPVELQPVWIAEHGRLRVHRDSSTPVGRQLAMGMRRVELFRFRLENGPEEEIDVTRLAAFKESLVAAGGLTNMYLQNSVTGEIYGGTLASFDSSTGAAIFDSISNLRIPRNGVVTIGFFADVLPWLSGAISGDEFRITINKNIFGDPARLLFIQATGHDSGYGLGAEDVAFGSDAVDGTAIYGGQFTIYRSVLSVALHTSTPSGHQVGREAQTVAQFVLTSTSPGGFPLTVEDVEPVLQSSILLSGLAGIKLWLGAAGPVENLLDELSVGGMLSSLLSIWGSGRSFDVPADTSRIIIVTADTQEALPGNLLRVDLQRGRTLTYSDGLTTGIVPDQTPIFAPELSY